MILRTLLLLQVSESQFGAPWYPWIETACIGSHLLWRPHQEAYTQKIFLPKMLILIKMITCDPMKFYTEMLHFQESCQMKCAWFVYIQFIPTMFSLMINYLNKYTFDFLYVSCFTQSDCFIFVRTKNPCFGACKPTMLLHRCTLTIEAHNRRWAYTCYHRQDFIYLMYTYHELALHLFKNIGWKLIWINMGNILETIKVRFSSVLIILIILW